MDVEVITSDIMENLKLRLIEKVNALLPKLMDEITPALVKIAKDMINKELHNSTEINHSVSCNKEVSQFKSVHGKYMDRILESRNSEYYKYTRCKNLLQLYNEGLQCEPMYIPRKFREDNIHVKSTAELSVINKLELRKLQAECEILCLRKEEFAKRIGEFDIKVETFIKENTTSSKAQSLLIEQWYRLAQEDICKIKENWLKKIESTREAFQRDKKYLQSHSRLPIGLQSASLSTAQPLPTAQPFLSAPLLPTAPPLPTAASLPTAPPLPASILSYNHNSIDGSDISTPSILKSNQDTSTNIADYSDTNTTNDLPVASNFRNNCSKNLRLSPPVTRLKSQRY